MRTVVRRCLGAFVYTSDEPASVPVPLRLLLERLLELLPGERLKIASSTVGGRSGRSRKFSWETYDELVRGEKNGDVWVWSEVGEIHFRVEFYLRHNPQIGPGYGLPGSLALLAEFPGEEPPDAVTAAARLLLSDGAGIVSPLHGGMSLFPDWEHGDAEIWGNTVDLDRKPAELRERWSFDSGRKRALWDKARRLYSVTLIGPALAETLGGKAAAENAGALTVEEIAGGMLVRATDTLLSPYDEGFLGKTVTLREWLWPESIQNPADAHGFTNINVPSEPAAENDDEP